MFIGYLLSFLSFYIILHYVLTALKERITIILEVIVK